jgi:uncharacterized protein (DUF736 family)
MQKVEIGAAWPKRSKDDRDYLSVELDDPSFNAVSHNSALLSRRR